MAKKHTQQIKLLVFAKKNGMILTPLGWEKHILQFNKQGHCPCDVARPDCPCPEAITEVHEEGHCKCSLFWRSYDTFLAQCYLDEWPEFVKSAFLAVCKT